ncbi:MAG: hypothetical protein V3T05_00675, partial [Myxococcota bacterium]
IVEAFASKKVIWVYRDGFARDLAAPRSKHGRNEYDGMLRSLTPKARDVMREHLLAGGLFNIGVTDAEEALAAHLEALDIP